MIRDGWAPDRRRGDRRVVALSLQVLVESGGDLMRVHELGAGGMVLESTRPLASGGPLVFRLGLAGDTVGPIQGRVAHSRVLLPKRVGEPASYLAGVTFEHVTADHAAHIARLLATIDGRRADRSQGLS
jgi:hypothetical protein